MNIRREILEHIIDLYKEYSFVIPFDYIEKYKIISTVNDEKHIEKLMNNCVTWTLKKDWDDKYVQRLKRDEIKVLERVKYRVEKLK